MNATSNVELSDAQRAQFLAEMDTFAETITDSFYGSNPIVGVLVSRVIDSAKAQPESTMGLLVSLGRDIQQAVQRVKDAAPPILERGSDEPEH